MDATASTAVVEPVLTAGSTYVCKQRASKQRAQSEAEFGTILWLRFGLLSLFSPCRSMSTLMPAAWHHPSALTRKGHPP